MCLFTSHLKQVIWEVSIKFISYFSFLGWPGAFWKTKKISELFCSFSEFSINPDSYNWKGRWVKLSGIDLLPGDVVSIGRQVGQGSEERTVPADMLLLSGSVITNEALLTGESTPQWKVYCNWVPNKQDNIKFPTTYHIPWRGSEAFISSYIYFGSLSGFYCWQACRRKFVHEKRQNSCTVWGDKDFTAFSRKGYFSLISSRLIYEEA